MRGKRYYIFLVLFLAGLSAFGPFVNDMYLPTLPSMAKVFGTTESMVQLGLTTSLIGLALGQVFLGPISEKYGRKPVIMWSMLLFLGLVFTSASTLAMDAGRVSIGAASALVGSMGFLIGSVVSPLVGIGQLMITTALLYIASALVVFLSAFIYYRYSAGSDKI